MIGVRLGLGLELGSGIELGLDVGLGRSWGKVGGRGWIRVRKRDLPLFLTLIITQTLSTPTLGQGLPLNKTAY